jgi:hypothetical protein
MLIFIVREDTMGQLKDVVEKEVALKVAKKECFTCYDITKEVRSNTDEDIYHQDVRAIIHSMYNNGEEIFNYNDYLCKTCAFHDGTLVGVFHDPSVDPQDYIRDIDKSVSSTTTPVCGNCSQTIYDLQHENAILLNLMFDLRSVYDSDVYMDLWNTVDEL